MNTRSGHNFQISGYINTAAGPVTTTVAQNINFANLQYFKIQSAIYEQNINQTTTIHSVVTTHNAGDNFTDTVHDSWPLKLNITLLFNPDGSGTQATTIDQDYERDEETRHNGQATSFSLIQNRVTPDRHPRLRPRFRNHRQHEPNKRAKLFQLKLHRILLQPKHHRQHRSPDQHHRWPRLQLSHPN